VLYTAGKDGKICEIDLFSGDTKAVAFNDAPIYCMAHDEKNQTMWYGTDDSTIKSVKLPSPSRSPIE